MKETKKEYLSLRIRPELKKAIETAAKEEFRSPGNLGELLLEWAFDQLKFAGNSIELKRRIARPPAEAKSSGV